MMAYLKPAEIELAWRASGNGLCIIVEGETAQDDAWYFGKWFNNRAQDFTFFPQNGWEQVINAVTVLRPILGSKKVYGIRDRDFEPLVSLTPFPADGILRTPKYTLENYLLDSSCWHLVTEPLLQRHTSAQGWMTESQIANTIET
ncbi:MAG: DUF4435 domain-containing protein, partial [Chloroflexi bacterium]|nr:DUF4435 domain-containing protein [Chloroflexota bacterium]